MSCTPDPARRQPPDFALDVVDDRAFAEQGPAIAAYLYTNFPGLRGLSQHRPHFDPVRERTTDPVEHTVEALAYLDTVGLASDDVRIVRVAAVFHDIGKLRDPLNVRHAVESAALCPPYLADFALAPAARDDVVAIVANHDTLGRVAQGKLAPEEAVALFGSRRIAALCDRLTRADIGSIRGLHGILPSIAEAYAGVLERFTTTVATCATPDAGAVGNGTVRERHDGRESSRTNLTGRT